MRDLKQQNLFMHVKFLLKEKMGKSLINIALFGLGRIGQMHAENLLKHKSFNLKYIFDKDKKKIKKLSKIYNCHGIKILKLHVKIKY